MFNPIHRLQTYRLVRHIVQREFIPEVTTYSYLYYKYVLPIYPMSYKTFLRIINFSDLDKKLAAAIADESARRACAQEKKQGVAKLKSVTKGQRKLSQKPDPASAEQSKKPREKIIGSPF